MNVVVRGGLDGKILTLAYQVTAWGVLSKPDGQRRSFFRRIVRSNLIVSAFSSEVLKPSLQI